MRIPRTAALLILLAAVPAAAQTQIAAVGWELSSPKGKERAPYVAVTELRASPDVKFSDRLRAIVTLKNPTAKAVEGLVLRYAVRLRLLRAGDPPEKAFWGVPFYTEEVRVSKIAPGSERQARVLRLDLAEQLRKLRGTGFTPEALKLEVMLCPRLGDEPSSIVREAVIDIVKP